MDWLLEAPIGTSTNGPLTLPLRYDSWLANATTEPQLWLRLSALLGSRPRLSWLLTSITGVSADGSFIAITTAVPLIRGRCSGAGASVVAIQPSTARGTQRPTQAQGGRQVFMLSPVVPYLSTDCHGSILDDSTRSPLGSAERCSKCIQPYLRLGTTCMDEIWSLFRY